MSQFTFNTEAIYQALFALVSQVKADGSGFVTVSRKLKHWTDVNGADQPALFQCQGIENYKPRQGLPPKVTLECKLWLYAKYPQDTSGLASPVLNPLKDAIFQALAPSVITGVQNLGGLVYHAWIEGDILTDEGVLGDQAAMVIPVKIMVNN